LVALNALARLAGVAAQIITDPVEVNDPLNVLFDNQLIPIGSSEYRLDITGHPHDPLLHLCGMQVIRGVSNHPDSIYTPQVRNPGLCPMQCHQIQRVISLLHEGDLLCEVDGLSVRAIDSYNIRKSAVGQVETDNVKSSTVAIDLSVGKDQVGLSEKEAGYCRIDLIRESPEFEEPDIGDCPCRICSSLHLVHHKAILHPQLIMDNVEVKSVVNAEIIIGPVYHGILRRSADSETS
jgi:hypothetical protein